MNVFGPLFIALWVLYGVVSVAAVHHRGSDAPLWLRWPTVTWNALMRPIDRAVYGPTPKPKADPVRIAVLEHELLGIEPEPGTAAAAAVNLRTAFGPTEH